MTKYIRIVPNNSPYHPIKLVLGYSKKYFFGIITTDWEEYESYRTVEEAKIAADRILQAWKDCANIPVRSFP